MQTGLNIDLVDELGNTESVTVPWWWKAEPWKKSNVRVKAYNNIEVADDLLIKRIVLLYDESLSEPDIEGAPHQFHGVPIAQGSAVN